MSNCARPRWQVWTVRLAVCVAAVALVAWLLRGLDWQRLHDAALGVPWWLWCFVMAAVIGTHALRAARLCAEWGPRIGLRFGAAWRLQVLHNAAVNTLPMRAGEAGYAWLLHRDHGVRLSESLPSLVWLRVQDALMLLAWTWLMLAPLPLGARAGLLLIAMVAVARWAPGLLQGMARKLPRKLSEALASRRGGVRSWLCSAGNWTLKLVAVAALLLPLAGLSISAALQGALAGELAALLPLQGPAGLGTYEAGVLGGSLWGSPVAATPAFTSSLVAAALLVHALWFLTGLLAAALTLMFQPAPAALADAPADLRAPR
jgi:uncharacterized membrane protein YbhN (UPF0104 family)